MIRHPSAFRTAPEPFTGMQLWGGCRPPTDLHPQGRRERSTHLGRVGRAAINQEHDVPAPSGLAHLAHEGLVGGHCPVIRGQPCRTATRDVARPMDHPSGIVAGDGPRRLAPDLGPAGAPGGVSQMKVSSNLSTTVRRRSLRPRLSPLGPGAHSVSAAPGQSAAASSGSRVGAGSVARPPHSPPALDGLASLGTAMASSLGLPDSPTPEARSPAPSPAPDRSAPPTAAGGLRGRHP
jgi:hypothetical protein